jgi:serine/threonine protein kinase
MSSPAKPPSDRYSQSMDEETEQAQANARVRNDATVATQKRSTTSGQPLARLGDRLGSPVWLATSVLVLAAFVGVVSTVSSYRALRHSGELRANAALERRAAHLRESLGAAFGVADPLLDELRAVLVAHQAGDPLEPVFERMRLLATARRGLTWMSASFPDGTFAGIFVDERGRITVQESRVGVPTGVVRRYEFDPARPNGLRLTSEGPTDYDPRHRSFYQLAAARRTRTWTDPYAFLRNLRTGVSRVEPLYADQADARSLRAVLTVDFDASELAKLLDRPIVPGERLLVLADDGSVLASSGERARSRVVLTRTRPLRPEDMHDRTLARAVRASRPGATVRARRQELDGAFYRVDRIPVFALGDHAIALFSLVPEDELYAPARREAASGVIFTAAISLVGLAFAFVLAASIARLRRKREQAELEVVRVKEQIAELGSYELLARLGAGGMGEVWRAPHKLLARDAALKLIRSDIGGNDHARNKRFFDEAKLLASMRSQHTVAVYDFGVASDGRYFLAMELLLGLDLDELVRAHGPQPPARVASILAQICDSLREAHDAGLVHQDIKPANVFLCRLAEALDVVKVLDFGLTRAVGKRSTDGRTVEGTPAFIAPEQATGGAVGPAADLYAVGCVGFWLLTGRYPYDADSTEDYLRAHVSGPVPELPESVRERIPAGLTLLLTRCLAKKPDRRPSSAMALAKAFRQVEAECPESFTPDELALFWRLRGERDVHSVPPRRGSQTTIEEGATLDAAGATIRVAR